MTETVLNEMSLLMMLGVMMAVSLLPLDLLATSRNKIVYSRLLEIDRPTDVKR